MAANRPIRHPKLRIEHEDNFKRKLDQPRVYMSAWSENGNTLYASNDLSASDLVAIIADASTALAQLDAVDRRNLR